MSGQTAGVADQLAARIRRRGPVPYDEVIEAALYDRAHGFYATGGAAGRRGDFLTSPEVGPLYGAVIARALDAWWAEMGRPDPFVVVEAAAGRGALAQTVLAASPVCAPALRYVLVERSAALRARQSEHLTLVNPALAFAPLTGSGGGSRSPVARDGPVVVSLAELPSLEQPAVVVANELLDNLAFRVLARTASDWDEVRVGLTEEPVPSGQGDAAASPRSESTRLAEVLVPADDLLVALAERLAPDAEVGSRIPVQDQAAGWLRSALDTAGPGGRAVVFDYAATTADLAARPWRDWLRTYAGHQRAGGPLDHLGHQDITADVCTDQLARVRLPSADRPQADFLRAHGIDALVDEGRHRWAEGAAVGDLAALRARSRVSEAEALCDQASLGAFRALEWLP